MVVRCYILGVESTLDAITIINDLIEAGEAPPEFNMHGDLVPVDINRRKSLANPTF